MLLKDQSSTVIQEEIGHCLLSPYETPTLTYMTPPDHNAAGCAISVGKGIIRARQRGICSLRRSVLYYQSRGTRTVRSARSCSIVREKGGFNEQDSREISRANSPSLLVRVFQFRDSTVES